MRRYRMMLFALVMAFAAPTVDAGPVRSAGKYVAKCPVSRVTAKAAKHAAKGVAKGTATSVRKVVAVL